MLLCSLKNPHSVRPADEKDIKALVKQRNKDVTAKCNLFLDKLNQPSSTIYFLIDDLLGKDYQDFRAYYKNMTKNNSYKLELGTLYELANEALKTNYSEEVFRNNKILKNLANDTEKGEEFYIAAINNDGTYKDLTPLTD